MSRFQYYESLKQLARDVRKQSSITTPRVLISDLRRVYKVHGLRLDLWRGKLRTLRGAYFNDDLGPSVMIAAGLPPEPRIFTMAHELKHHLVDRDGRLSYCDPSNAEEMIEIGAEVFAAELIFPDQDFATHLDGMGVAQGACTAETLVRLKRSTRTTLSYTALTKKAVFLKFATNETFKGVKWRMLEESLYGEPIYKRINRWRRARLDGTGS